MTASTRLGDGPDWERLIEETEALDISQRLDLEAHIAACLSRALGQLDVSVADGSAPERIRLLLARIDEAFGWTEDVRRLVRILGRNPETDPLVRAVETIGGPRLAPRESESGFPLIEPFDVEAYFGSAGRRVAAAYARARAEESFTPGWSWSACLSPCWWLARHGYGLAAAILSGGIVVLVALLFEPIESATEARDYVSFLFVMLALRIAFATQTVRLEVHRLARLVRVADRDMPGRTDKRRAFLAGLRQGGRFPSFVFAALFFVMVDLYATTTIGGALQLDDAIVSRYAPAERAGSLFDRIAVQAFLDHRSRTLARIDSSLARPPAGRTAEAKALADEARRVLGSATPRVYWAQWQGFVTRAESLGGTGRS
jgi:hypothetical protein